MYRWRLCRWSIAGLGISIVSTSKGVMSDAEARANNVGGEVHLLCLLGRGSGQSRMNVKD
jgi:ribosomal protein S8